MDHIHKATVFHTGRRLFVAGFSLVELAVVLFIVSLLFGVFAGASSGFLQGKSIEADRAKLRAIETAIASFVSVNGRLPCPADGSLASTNASVGTEVRDANGDCTAGIDQKTGVVPWTSLAITEADAADSYQRRITYRVAYGLARNSAMDFTACDPAGTGTADIPATSTSLCSSAACLAVCRTTCINSDLSLCTPPSAVLAATRGVLVRSGLASDATSIILMDNSVSPTQGAAYVLVAHGKNGAGAYNLSSGVLTAGTAGDKEAQNANNQIMNGWYAVDADYNESGGSGNYDDLVLRASIMKVVMQAQRGPRAH